MCYSRSAIPVDYEWSSSQHTAYFPCEQISRLSDRPALVQFGLTAEIGSYMESFQCCGIRGVCADFTPLRAKWVAALMATEEGDKEHRPDMVNQACLAKGWLEYRDSLRVAITAFTPHSKYSFIHWMDSSWRRNPRLVHLFRSNSKISHLAQPKLCVEIFLFLFVSW